MCYNWMPVWGWYRTNVDIQLNGGSKVTGFRMSDLRDAPKYAVPVRADQLWSNLEYFLKRVVPVAEKYKVQVELQYGITRKQELPVTGSTAPYAYRYSRM